MRMKLFAVAALSALPAVALAEQYIVVQEPAVVAAQPVQGTVVQAQPAQPVQGAVVQQGTVVTAQPATVAVVPTTVLTVPKTQNPGDQGPGAIDRTHPDPANDVGTSSAP